MKNDDIVVTNKRDPVNGSLIREFTDMELTKSVIDAANQVPDGHKLALVGYINSAQEARLAVLVKPGKDWSISGVMQHTPSAGWRGEVGVVWSPF